MKDQKQKQANTKSYSLDDFKVGDLVWASVKGYPRWPGQVADPDKAAERHLAIRKPNTLLIYFFGDRSFGWFQPDTLAPFEELFDQLSTVKTKQANFRRAVEEGKEVLDRRTGRQPATQHYAWDALDTADERNQPGYQERGESDGDGEGGWRRDLRPPEPTAEVARRCTAPAALAWLHALAMDPHSEPSEAAQAQAASAARLVFSLVRAQLVKLVAKPVVKRRAAALQANGQPSKASASQASETPPPPPAKKRKTERKPARSPTPAESDDPVGYWRRRAEEDNFDENDIPDEVREAYYRVKDLEYEEHHREATDEELQAVLAAEEAAKAERRAERKAAKAATRAAQRANAAHEALKERGLSNVERELRVQLPEAALGLAAIARSPLAFLDGQVGSSGAAALRWREAAYAKSRLRTEGGAGEALLEVLGGGGVSFARKRRAEPGVPPPPDLEHVGKAPGDQYRFYLGADYVPATREAFDHQLAAFYERHGAAQAAPVLDHQPLDLWALMRAVAQRGGYQAVSALRQWGAVTRELRPDSTNVSASSTALVKHYRKLLLALEADLVASTGTKVEMRPVQRGGKSSAKTPAQAAAKVARREARVAAVAKAGRSLAETPEGAALGFGDVAMAAASSTDGGGSSPSGSTSSSEDDDSEDDAALVSRMREVEGRAAEAGLSAKAAKRARLQAAADRRKARPAPQPAELDPIAKRQAAEKTAKMLSDFDSLHSMPASQPGSGVQHQLQQHQRQLIVPVKRQAQPRPAQARAPDSDRRKTIVLRFPKGYPLPSQSQVLLAGTNSGQLSNKDVHIFPKSYAACLEYANAETARKAEQWFTAHAERIFKVARGETVRVTRETKKEKDVQQRPSAAAGSRPPAQRPGPASSTPAPTANTGVPFDPRAGVPYMPPDDRSSGAAPAAAGIPYDPRRGVGTDPRHQAAPPPAAAPPLAPIPYDPRRGGQLLQPAAQQPVQQYDQQRHWVGGAQGPPVRHPQPAARGYGRQQPVYGQAVAPVPARQAVPPAADSGTGYGAAYGAGGCSAYGDGPVPPPASTGGSNSPGRVELPIGPELAAILQGMQQASSAAPPPAAPPAPPPATAYYQAAPRPAVMLPPPASISAAQQQPHDVQSEQQPRDVQSELMTLLAKLHGTS